MPLRIVQITDTHIYDDPSGELSGINTRQSLESVLQYIEKQLRAIDLLVLSGDITHESGLPAYRYIHQRLQRFGLPTFWLPGNHDILALMQETIGKGSELAKSAEAGGWKIIFLDSHVEIQPEGALAQSELDFLESQLADNQQPVLIFLHHHLVPAGCAWLDPQVVANADDFFTLVAQYPQVKAIVSGHVHQVMDQQKNGIRLLATPSTCMQFKPNSDDYAEDDIAPGFRYIDLFENGSLHTEVIRVPINPDL
ncbi:MAG: 3',5'-cyclic-AMP phosphodiesterase [Pseudomonadales bacterium]|nr:3',5'-cyclic-AMP phosphodiesterase [Pseudomonadales bacterium]